MALKFLAAVATGLLAAVMLSAPVMSEDLGPVSPDSDFSAHHITQALHKAKAGERVDFSGRDLTYLDLSELNFKGAMLARSDFYGADFTGANLSGADLSGTRLDRSVLIRADLSGANLSGATIYRPTIYTDMSTALSDAPRFAGANLTGIYVQAELSGADFRGAHLTDAHFRPLEERPGQGTLVTLSRNVLKSCDFSGARLHNADMTRAVLWFSRFTGADLTGAKLVGADLSHADFSGADLTGADLTEADLDGTNFVGAKGFDTVKGLAAALNFDKAVK